MADGILERLAETMSDILEELRTIRIWIGEFRELEGIEVKLEGERERRLAREELVKRERLLESGELDKPISDLHHDVSVRTANFLDYLQEFFGVKTLRDLVVIDEATILSRGRGHNFGRKSLSELKDRLDDQGLSLGMKLE